MAVKKNVLSLCVAWCLLKFLLRNTGLLSHVCLNIKVEEEDHVKLSPEKN